MVITVKICYQDLKFIDVRDVFKFFQVIKLIDWHQCPRCKKWIPSYDKMIRHFELMHITYTPFEKPFGG